MQQKINQQIQSIKADMPILANEINFETIPQQTLNLYENNKRTPNFITAMKISSAFGLNIETMIIYGLDLIDIYLKQISHFPKLDGYC